MESYILLYSVRHALWTINYMITAKSARKPGVLENMAPGTLHAYEANIKAKTNYKKQQPIHVIVIVPGTGSFQL